MFFKKIYTPGLSINSYLLGDEKTKECVVVDPTRHVIPYIIEAQNAGLDIVAVLETHVHADFVSGAKELKHQLNGKPLIYASGMGGEQWIPSYIDEVVLEGTQLKIGDLRLCSLHTPGHTPEHVIWICYDESRSVQEPWFAFTGDCLFVGGVGRPDLQGKQETSTLAARLYHSLFEVLAYLPDFTEIFPCHGNGSVCGKSLETRATSTLGYERLFNPSFKRESFDKWKEKLLTDQPSFPPYFKCVKKLNVTGPQLMSSLKLAQWSEGNEKPAINYLFLLDIRHPEIFASSHIQGSLNIPYSATFSQWAGRLLPENQSIGLVIDNNHVFTEVGEQLRIMGFDQDLWIIQLEKEKEEFSDHLTSLGMLEVVDLVQHQPQFSSLFLLDVRTIDEWNCGHIAGSHHTALHLLESSFASLSHDRPIAIICRSGQRASIAASLLKKNGFSTVFNVRGGIQAWQQAGLPLRTGKASK